MLLLSVAVAGCAGGRSEAPPLPLSAESLVGRWDRQAELDGRAVPLYVDSTFVFTSVGDTLFRYWYEVRDDTLFFDDRQGGVSRPDVEKLTADSLVLSRLPFTDRTLRFRRSAGSQGLRAPAGATVPEGRISGRGGRPVAKTTRPTLSHRAGRQAGRSLVCRVTAGAVLAPRYDRLAARTASAKRGYRVLLPLSS